MNSFSRIFRGGAVLGGLLMICITSLGAVKELPTGPPVHRVVQDFKAPHSIPSLAQNPQSSEPQDPNSQSQPSSLVAEHVVAKPPEVIYKDGQLTIIAENSSLADVMAALRTAVGADIGLPTSSASQRIWVRLGPGPARKVLRDLLESTELNFVIQASETDEDGIRSVLLTPRSKPTDSGGVGSQLARGASRRGQPANSSPVETPEQDGTAPPELAASSEAAPTVPPPEAAAAQSSASNQQSMTGGSETSLSSPVGKSRDQMIQQLQSMYEQRRQMQAQQNRKPPGTN